MPQQGDCGSEAFRVVIVTEYRSYFGSPGALPKSQVLFAFFIWLLRREKKEFIRLDIFKHFEYF